MRRELKTTSSLVEMSADRLTETEVRVPVVIRRDGLYTGQAKRIVRRRSRHWFAFRVTSVEDVALTDEQVAAVKEDVRGQMERSRLLIEAMRDLDASIAMEMRG